MISSSKSSCAKMTPRSLRKIVFGLLCELHATSKPCAAIIAAKCMPETLRKATMLFSAFSLPRNQTS